MKRIFSLALVLVMMFTLLFMVSAQGTETNEYLQEMQGVGELVGIAPMNTSTIDGHIEQFDARFIRGWAFSRSFPSDRIQVQITISSRVSGQFISQAWGWANLYRQDLHNHTRGRGGDGHHMFNIEWNGGLYWGRGDINVRIMFFSANDGRPMGTHHWRSPYNGPFWMRPAGYRNARIEYSITGRTQAFWGNWVTPIRTGARHWNDANVGAGVNLVENARGDSHNTIDAHEYTWMAYGRVTLFNSQGGVIRDYAGGRAHSFQMEINIRHIANQLGDSTAVASRSNLAIGTVVHEFGHVLWLDDEPIRGHVTAGGPQRSVMIADDVLWHNIFRPQRSDISAVRLRYSMPSRFPQ